MQRPPLTIKARAKLRMMDLLAQRDHSEKELRQKLRQYLRPKKRRGYPYPSPEELEVIMKDIQEAIDAALAHAADSKWLAAPEKISDQLTQALNRRKKGIHYINQYLNEKGLPPIKADPEVELAKALELLQRKFPDISSSPREIKAKAMRFLASRGFTMDIIRQALDSMTP
ncbi:MAG: regulatory protein RecX [Bdellovibrionia bacterium]